MLATGSISKDDAKIRGDIHVTICRGSGVTFKTVEEYDGPNTLAVRSKELVTNGVVGHTDPATNATWKVGYISILDQGSGGTGTVKRYAVAGVQGGTANNVVTWKTSTSSTPDNTWGTITNSVPGTGTATIDFQLEENETSQSAAAIVSAHSHDPATTIYLGDRYKVEWTITVGGMAPAGIIAGAKGLIGSIADCGDSVYQSSAANLTAPTLFNKGAGYAPLAEPQGETYNVPGSSIVTISWPNTYGTPAVEYDWAGHTGKQTPILAQGTTMLALGSSWSGANYDGPPPLDVSRVSAKFRLTATTGSS